jgi:uncharacterized membrane protein YadS
LLKTKEGRSLACFSFPPPKARISLASLSVFNKDQVNSLANLSRWAFLLTFAGVGLRINFKEMKKQGIRPFIVGALGEVVIAAITLGLVLDAGKLVKL